jgi:hypothetical protein
LFAIEKTLKKSVFQFKIKTATYARGFRPDIVAIAEGIISCCLT